MNFEENRYGQENFEPLPQDTYVDDEVCGRCP